MDSEPIETGEERRLRIRHNIEAYKESIQQGKHTADDLTQYLASEHAAPDFKEGRTTLDAIGAGAQAYSDAATFGLSGLADDAVTAALGPSTFAQNREFRKANKDALSPAVRIPLEIAGAFSMPGTGLLKAGKAAMTGAKTLAGAREAASLIKPGAQFFAPAAENAGWATKAGKAVLEGAAQGGTTGAIENFDDTSPEGLARAAKAGAVSAVLGGTVAPLVGGAVSVGSRALGRARNIAPLGQKALEIDDAIKKSSDALYTVARGEAKSTGPIRDVLESQTVKPYADMIRSSEKFANADDATVLMETYKLMSEAQRTAQKSIEGTAEYQAQKALKHEDISLAKDRMLQAAETPDVTGSAPGQSVVAKAGLANDLADVVATQDHTPETIYKMTRGKRGLGRTRDVLEDVARELESDPSLSVEQALWSAIDSDAARDAQYAGKHIIRAAGMLGIPENRAAAMLKFDFEPLPRVTGSPKTLEQTGGGKLNLNTMSHDDIESVTSDLLYSAEGDVRLSGRRNYKLGDIVDDFTAYLKQNQGEHKTLRDALDAFLSDEQIRGKSAKALRLALPDDAMFQVPVMGARNAPTLEQAAQSPNPGIPSLRAAIENRRMLEGQRKAFQEAADVGSRTAAGSPIKGKRLLLDSKEAFARKIPNMTPEEADLALAGILGRNKEAVKLSPSMFGTFGLIPSAARTVLASARTGPIVTALEKQAGRNTAIPAIRGRNAQSFVARLLGLATPDMQD